MMNIIKGITNSRGNIPVIISGDFNVIEGKTAYIAMTQTYGYSNASKIAKESENKATYNGMGESSSIIDYIFVSSHLKTMVETYKVCPEKINGEYVSDHNAIIAKIAVP